MIICEVCGLGSRDGVTVYRENTPGDMPPIWRCREHREKPVDPEVQEIVDIVEEDRGVKR